MQIVSDGRGELFMTHRNRNECLNAATRSNQFSNLVDQTIRHFRIFVKQFLFWLTNFVF